MLPVLPIAQNPLRSQFERTLLSLHPFVLSLNRYKMMMNICLLGFATLLVHASAGQVDVYKNFLSKAELKHFLDAPLEIDSGGGLQAGAAVLERATAKRIHEMTGLGDLHEDFYDSEERYRVLQTKKLKSWYQTLTSMFAQTWK